jgi:hypothetical protein
MHELQMWCPAPLPEGEIQRRKLRSDKYKPPAGRQLENYESDSSVEADEDTDTEVGADPVVDAAKSRRRTKSTVAKKSSSVFATAISAVKAAEQKKEEVEGYIPFGRHYSNDSDASFAGGRLRGRGGGEGEGEGER